MKTTKKKAPPEMPTRQGVYAIYLRAYYLHATGHILTPKYPTLSGVLAAAALAAFDARNNHEPRTLAGFVAKMDALFGADYAPDAKEPA